MLQITDRICLTRANGAFLIDRHPRPDEGCGVHIAAVKSLDDAFLFIQAPALREALKELLPYVPGFNETDFAVRPWLAKAIKAIELSQQSGAEEFNA